MRQFELRVSHSYPSMSQYNSNQGCSFCNQRGVYLDGCVKYPRPGTEITRIQKKNGIEYEERIVIPQAVLRTDESINNAMDEADNEGKWVEGVKGTSVLPYLVGFNLANGFSTDDLYPLYKGLAEFHTGLLFQGVPGVSEKITPQQIKKINSRLEGIKTPTHISRKPRSVLPMKMW